MKNKIIRIKKQELEQIYGVNRLTITNWIQNYGLPIITINSHSQFVKESDLLEWENNKMKNKDKLERNECE